MDPKFLARAKARTGTVKGPPPLPATADMAERPTPRPPALDPDRPTPHPVAPDVPALAAPGSVADAAPLTPRPMPVEAPSADDEEEHTVMRPPTVPLPRDAFRDDGAAQSSASDGDPSVGLPLELAIERPSARRSRAGVAWVVLAALGLAAGALVLVKHREASSAMANAAAPAEPKSFTRPPRPPPPKRTRAQGKLDPPISTSFKDNESLPEAEVANAPTAVRRRPRPAPARPAASATAPEAAAPEQAEPGSAPAAAQGAAGSSGAASETQPGEPPPAQPQPGDSQLGTTPPPAGGPAPPRPAAAPGSGATPPPAPQPPPAASKPAESKPAGAAGEELPQGNVDPDNPYGD